MKGDGPARWWWRTAPALADILVNNAGEEVARPGYPHPDPLEKTLRRRELSSYGRRSRFKINDLKGVSMGNPPCLNGQSAVPGHGQSAVPIHRGGG